MPSRGLFRTFPGLALTLLVLLGGAACPAPDARAEKRRAAPGTVITTSVGHVKDGDSLVLLSAGERIETRIAEIDAPEIGQPYGRKAKRALLRHVEGQEVRLEVVDHDRYDRTVGRLLVGDTDVGRELVREGAAWVSRRYGRDRRLYELESEARRARRGLWALSEAERTPPWEWRDAHPRRLR
jgi:endonuclease YncB( thermonuclease family)